ncbi:hypothetical protein ASG58_16305 [Rhizobium sp. Leaf383]|nr:hypothetical protein ASG58_16305 [Rhizobium sp. Leaf383]
MRAFDAANGSAPRQLQDGRPRRTIATNTQLSLEAAGRRQEILRLRGVHHGIKVSEANPSLRDAL